MKVVSKGLIIVVLVIAACSLENWIAYSGIPLANAAAKRTTHKTRRAKKVNPLWNFTAAPRRILRGVIFGPQKPKEPLKPYIYDPHFPPSIPRNKRFRRYVEIQHRIELFREGLPIKQQELIGDYSDSPNPDSNILKDIQGHEQLLSDIEEIRVYLDGMDDTAREVFTEANTRLRHEQGGYKAIETAREVARRKNQKLPEIEELANQTTDIKGEPSVVYTTERKMIKNLLKEQDLSDEERSQLVRAVNDLDVFIANYKTNLERIESYRNGISVYRQQLNQYKVKFWAHRIGVLTFALSTIAAFSIGAVFTGIAIGDTLEVGDNFRASATDVHADSVSGSGATLSGAINSHGMKDVYYIFEYQKLDEDGHPIGKSTQVPPGPQPLPADGHAVASIPNGSLLPSSSTHKSQYAVTLLALEGPRGKERIEQAKSVVITTLKAPTVTVAEPAQVTAKGATLTGTINAEDRILEKCYFEVVSTPKAGIKVDKHQYTVDCGVKSNQTVSVEARATSLRANSTYDVTLTALPKGDYSSEGSAFFAKSLQTKNLPNILSVQEEASTSTKVTLQGKVNTYGVESQFRYQWWDESGKLAGNSDWQAVVDTAASWEITSMQPHTKYKYALELRNRGDIETDSQYSDSFQTSGPTGAAGSVFAQSVAATLNGFVYSMDISSSAWMEWRGEGEQWDSSRRSVTIQFGPSESEHELSTSITGLLPSTKYYFRVGIQALADGMPAGAVFYSQVHDFVTGAKSLVPDGIHPAPSTNPMSVNSNLLSIITPDVDSMPSNAVINRNQVVLNHRGIGQVQLHCLGSVGKRCEGTLRLSKVAKRSKRRFRHQRLAPLPAVYVASKDRRKKKQRLGVIAHTKYSLAAGSSANVQIRVSKANLALFKHGKLRVMCTVLGTSQQGLNRARYPLLLKLPY